MIGKWEQGTALAAVLISVTQAQAEVPRVAVDIAPVHSLVAQVMGDLGAPDLVLQPGASPHGYSMRPSEARALSRADIVFWIGEGLTPWLEAPLENLANTARIFELSSASGNTLYDYRNEALFSTDDHDDGDHEDHEEDGHKDEYEAGEHGHEEHDHDDDAHAKDAHGHDDDEANEGTGGEHDDHEGHDHSGTDMHLWLDPVNASVWLDVVRDILSEADPENAEAYATNAATAKKRLEGQIGRIEAALAPMQGKSFVLYHDAFQYFERRFGLSSVGSIAVSDATAPSAARVALIRDAIADQDVACLASEPQFSSDLAKTVGEGSDVKLIELDPLGANLSPGPELYGALLDGLTEGFQGCF